MSEPTNPKPEAAEYEGPIAWWSADGETHRQLQTLDVLGPAAGEERKRDATVADVLAALRANDLLRGAVLDLLGGMSDQQQTALALVSGKLRAAEAELKEAKAFLGIAQTVAGVMIDRPESTNPDDVPYDQWIADNPEAHRLFDLAHGWGEGDLFTEVKANAAPVATALRRMRSNAAHYLDELGALIDDQDYSEIFHHIEHVEFDVKSMDRLARTHARVLRGETEPEGNPPIEFFIGFKQPDGSYRHAVANDQDLLMGGYVTSVEYAKVERLWKQATINYDVVRSDLATHERLLTEFDAWLAKQAENNRERPQFSAAFTFAKEKLQNLMRTVRHEPVAVSAEAVPPVETPEFRLGYYRARADLHEELAPVMGWTTMPSLSEACAEVREKLGHFTSSELGLGRPARVIPELSEALKRSGDRIKQVVSRPPCSRNCEAGPSRDPKDHAVNCPNSEPAPPQHTCINTATTLDGQPPPACPACLADPIKFGIIGRTPIVPLPAEPECTCDPEDTGPMMHFEECPVRVAKERRRRAAVAVVPDSPGAGDLTDWQLGLNPADALRRDIIAALRNAIPKQPYERFGAVADELEHGKGKP